MHDTALSIKEYNKHLAVAGRRFGGLKTRYGVPVLERNRRLVQRLFSFSHDISRSVALAALYYQLPQERTKLPRNIRQLVRHANGLSAAVLSPNDYLNIISRGKIRPAAFLINLASALETLSDPRISEADKEKIGKVALDIHAPIAASLGLRWIQREIGELAFKHGHPREYAKVGRLLVTAERQFERNVLPFLREKIRSAAEEMGIHYEFLHRVKQPYSAFLKLRKKRSKLVHLHDAVGMRIVLHGAEENCYALLEKLKNQKSIKVRLDDDYISRPKPTGYKALHILVRRKGQKHWFELQIKTQEMHIQAESEDPKQLHNVHKMKYFPAATTEVVAHIASVVPTLLNSGTSHE